MQNTLEMKSRRLAVLLITKNKETDGSGFITIGKSEPTISYRGEMENYCELLSCSNILFDIIGEKELNENTFVDNNTIKYVAAIITVPFSSFSDDALRLIKEASSKLGISLISTFNHPDERSKCFFGILSFRGKKLLWPLIAKIKRWPRVVCQEEVLASYGLMSGVPGIRKKGLRKLSVRQTCTKGARLLRSLIFPYIRVELDSGAIVLATDMKDKPLAWSYEFGRATNYYFALHEGIFLDKFNEMHRLVRAAIEANSGYGMVSVNLENTMILRLDDPGACSADYLDNGGMLAEKDWKEFSKILENREIPVSVMYTPGWVDDGDKQSGKLFVDDKENTERRAGKIYDSARIRYVPLRSNNNTNDHASEFKGLKKMVEKGFADVHSHGLTHLDPDHKSWSKAEDRNKDAQWYHEFYHVKEGRPVKSDEQIEAMSASRDKILELFGAPPLAFTPSGHRHGDDCDRLSCQAGYLIFSADYTGILNKNILIRNWKIPSLFLYLKDRSPFAYRSGYPFIGVVHDYEIKKRFEKFIFIIDQWCVNGVKRFISLGDLVASLCTSIDAYYHARNATMHLILYLANHPRDGRLFPGLTGRKICLRIILPDKMILNENQLTISGGTLLLFEQGVHNSKVTILLRSSDNPVIRINFPLRPAVY